MLYMDSDLSFENIEFLQAVRDVVSSPDAFADTEYGKSPATTGAIRQASDLSYEQVRYRMQESSKLVSEGYIEVYSGQYDPDIGEDGGFGQRSAELTEKGVEALSNVEDEMMGGDVNPQLVENLVERVEQLEASGGGGDGGVDGSVRADVEAIQSDVESLQEDLQSLSAAVTELEDEVRRVSTGFAELEQSEWGGIAEEKKKDLSLMVERVPPMFYILQFVLGMDVSMVREEGGEIPPEKMDAVREGILGVLEGRQDRAVDSLEGGDRAEAGSDGDQTDRDIQPPSDRDE